MLCYEAVMVQGAKKVSRRGKTPPWHLTFRFHEPKPSTDFYYLNSTIIRDKKIEALISVYKDVIIVNDTGIWLFNATNFVSKLFI